MLANDFFRAQVNKKKSEFEKDPLLMNCLSDMKIINIVATANLDVKDINLKKLAQDNPFCNYDKCRFAAMGSRLMDGSTLLLYSMGVIVCMGTNNPLTARLACAKYCQVLNSHLNVECNITGFHVDNYVCTIFTFQLALDECIRDDWASVIEYDPQKFPGARARCKFMGLSFDTNVVVTFFESGKINITNAKSIYEAYYMFTIVYYRYIIHIRFDKNEIKENRNLDIKAKPVFNMDLQTPIINRNTDTINKLSSFVRFEDERGNMKYTGYYENEDNGRTTMKTIGIDDKYKHLPYEEIDKLIFDMGMRIDF